jgi:uncharacterized membrane protein
MNTPRTTYAVFLAGTFVWCGAILLAPYLAASASRLAVILYSFFHTICHQLPEHSFRLFGEQLAVCARCASIYFAFLFALIIYPLVRPVANSVPLHRNILFIALLPMVVDVGLDFLGIHDSDFLTRTITGVILGGTLPFVVLPVAVEGMQQLRKPVTITEH